MPGAARAVLGGLSALIMVWMLVLFFRGASITEENPDGADVAVTCASIVGGGWPGDGSYLSEKDYLDHPSDHVPSGTSLTDSRSIGIAFDCMDRRDTYLGTMAILAPIAAVLACVAILARRSTSAPA